MPLFFGGQITEINQFINASIAFLAFSLTASAIYILNDYQDIEEDREHPEKKNRPLASGDIPLKIALLLMSFLFVVGGGLMAISSKNAFAILGIYILLNIGYSYRFKHIAILDVTIIAIGFIFRVFVGSVVTGVPLSQWIVIMTFLLALFLALAKRRDDVVIFLETKKKMRKVINSYNLKFIEGAMMIMASVTIVSYILYTTSPEVVERLQSEYVYLTSLFVILGIMRYLQITFVEDGSGSPTKIVMKDRFLQLTILGWVLHFILLLYL